MVLAESHIKAFPSLKSNFLYYTPPDKKQLIESTVFKVDDTDGVGICGVKSMYSKMQDGHPVIVYCPYGYRYLSDFVEGSALYSTYMAPLLSKAESDQELQHTMSNYANFLEHYNNYLRTHGLQIIISNNPTNQKLCIPLVYIYLFVHQIDPENCQSTTTDYGKLAYLWVYDTENGLLSDSNIRAMGADPGSVDNEDKKRLIKKTVDIARMSIWQGLVYHEMYHILEGHLTHPATSIQDANEREIHADVFALKMMSFATKIKREKALKIGLFLSTQGFTASISTEDKFKQRIAETYTQFLPFFTSPDSDNFISTEKLERVVRLMRDGCEAVGCVMPASKVSTQNKQ